MKNILKFKGDLVNIDGHNIHIYRKEIKINPRLY